MIEIPLTNSPEQIFSIALIGETYDCRVALNSRTQTYSISFDGLIHGVAMVGGVDIVKQYNLPIKQLLILNVDDSNAKDSSSGLGSSSKVLMIE